MRKQGIAAFLCLLMVLSLCACGTSERKDLPIDSVVSEDGAACTVDITTKGELQADAEPVSSLTVEFDGSRYTFPLRVADFAGTKWTLSSIYDDPDHPSNVGAISFDGNSYGMASVSMRADSGASLLLSEVMNTNSFSMPLTGCWVRTIMIWIPEMTRTPECEFVLPGGITARSTAADILSVYGNPNGNSQFSSGSSTEDSFTYNDQETSGLSYEFTFYPDGGLEEVYVIIPLSTIERGGPRGS